MVALDQNAIGLIWAGEMPVADMPGESEQRLRIAGPISRSASSRRNHLGMAAVVQHQPVAMGKHDRLRQIDKHLVAMLQRQHLAAQMALVMGEHDDVERRRHPARR